MNDVNILIEAYRVIMEYVAVKDRQAAADHFVNAICEFSITDSDLKQLAATDSYIKRAAEEYSGEEFDIAHGDDDADY